MEMEVDEGAVPSSSGNHSLFVCCVSKKGGLKKSKIPVNDLNSLTLDSLRNSVIQELGKWEWAEGDVKPTNIDILHCSRVLKTDADVKKIGNLSVVTVIDKNRLAKNEDDDKHKLEKYIADYAKSHNIHEHLRSCSLALKTAFLNPKFVTMVENLGDSEMLENIFAIVPELKNDPVAIGIIQDPTLIFHLSDPEALKKLANTKPWVIEAFNFIAASIHQDKGGPPQGIPNHLFNAAFFDGDDESMEDDDDDGNMPGPSRGGSGAVITREQLASALSALGGAAGLPSSNAFGGLFQPPAPPRPQQPAAPPTNPGVAAAGANIQNLMNTLAGAGGAAPGQPLNSELVARAVTDALRRLTPEQRADQLNAIRNFATQIQQNAAAATPAAPQQQPNPPAPVAPTAPQSGVSSLSQQYQSQLRQMRDLGITDERLSILALRVSEGDVNTAAELIFSGWQGEGSDPV